MGRWRSLLLGAALLLLAAPSPADALEAESAAPAPERVSVLVKGELASQAHDALETVLRSVLADSQVSITLSPAGRDYRASLQAARRVPGTLLVSMLDTEEGDRWRLYVIDPVRGRAIVRELPGGLEGDSAMLEAVASIIASAVSALREGLEVASRPIEEIVVERPPPEDPLTPVAPGPATPVDRSSGNNPRAGRYPTIRSRVGAEIASFDATQAATVGASLALGAGLGPWSITLSGSQHLPSRIESSVGSFRLDRTRLGLLFGYQLSVGEVTIEPSFGPVAERLVRRDAEPGPSVAASDDFSAFRLGVGVSLGARLVLAVPLSLVLELGAADYPGRVRFLGGPGAEPLAAPYERVASALLGLEIEAPEP